VASSAVARRAFAVLRELRVEPEIRTYERHAFDRETRYQIHADGTPQALGVLEEAGVLDAAHRPLERPPGRVVARACCRSAYLRGAFLGGGSLSGPQAPHLEVRFPTHAGASFVRAVASVEDVRLRVVDRASHAAAYAKAWDAIEGYLAVAGATDAVLALEERAVVASARANANRIANADHANLVRQSAAAERQLAAVRRLAAAGELERLAPALREVAELRLRHPAVSLRELARRTDPVVTAATVQRRLARIVALADGS
jgi:DNA-binding protein WhiA